MTVTRETITSTGLGMRKESATTSYKRAWAIAEREGYVQVVLNDNWHIRDPDGGWARSDDLTSRPDRLYVTPQKGQPKHTPDRRLGFHPQTSIPAGTPLSGIVAYEELVPPAGVPTLITTDNEFDRGLALVWAPRGYTTSSNDPTQSDYDWWMKSAALEVVSGFTDAQLWFVRLESGAKTYYENFFGAPFVDDQPNVPVQLVWDAGSQVYCSVGGYLPGTLKSDYANNLACFDMVADLENPIVYIAGVKTNREIKIWKIENNVQSLVATQAAISTNTGNKRLLLCYLPGGRLGIVTMDTNISGGRPNIWYTSYSPASNVWGTWTRVETNTDWGSNAISPLVGWHSYPQLGFMRLVVSRRLSSTAERSYLYSIRANEPPTAPTWVNESGSAYDRGSDFVLEWNFNDPNPSDIQSAYRVRRTDNRGTFYRTATGWTTTLDNSSKLVGPTTQLTLPSGWAATGQGTHQYYVQTWDSEDEISPWSPALNVNHGDKDNPTITSPANNAEVAQRHTVTWTSASQAAYRIEIRGGSATGRVIYDSGEVIGTTRSHTLTFDVNNVDRWILLCTWSRLQVMSDQQVVRVQVRYVPPIAPTVTAQAFDDDAGIRITTVQSTIPPGSTAPAVETYDIYRRVGTDTTTEIKIADQIDAAEDVYWDYTAASDTNYLYRVTVHGSDLSNESTWVS